MSNHIVRPILQCVGKECYFLHTPAKLTSYSAESNKTLLPKKLVSIEWHQNVESTFSCASER